MPTLMLTIGLPRSGKSSWSRTAGFPIVNPDSIRLALHGQPHLPEREGEVWKTAHLMVEALFLAGHETVILDATNTMKRRRQEWQSAKWTRSYKVFATPQEECVRRAFASKTEYLIPVIARMARQWEPLEASEYD